VGVLDHMYSCDFTRVENVIVQNVQGNPDLAGNYRNSLRNISLQQPIVAKSCTDTANLI